MRGNYCVFGGYDGDHHMIEKFEFRPDAFEFLKKLHHIHEHEMNWNAGVAIIRSDGLLDFVL